MLKLHKIYKDEFRENFMRDFLDPHYKGGKYLFGTNETASALATALTIDGFINTRDKNLREFMGKPVIHNPASLDSDALVMSCVHLGAAAADILLSAFSFRHLDAFALSKVLTGGGGLHKFDLNLPPNFDSKLDLKMLHFDGFDEDIKANFDKYAKIYNRFVDTLSRHIFQNLIDFKISGDTRYIRGFELAHDRQYFEDFLELPKNPSFVDAGGYTGDTALQFILRYPKFSKILLFEPEEQNIAQARQNLKSYDNIECIQKGLSDKNETLRFSANNSASSVSEDGELVIEVARLDDIMQNNGVAKVDFIKMDIEGSEGAAIEGAKQTIAKYHPTLAICVYHKKDDFWKIPEQILAIRNDYKLYFRHYTQGTDESVMYFVPMR